MGSDFGVTLAELSSTGALLSPAAGFGGKSYSADTLAFDGLNTIWTVNLGGQAGLAHISNAGASLLVSSAAAYQLPLATPGSEAYSNAIRSANSAPAIDASGNIWITGSNGSLQGQTYLTKFIGLAAPVVTPVVQAAKGNKIAQRP